MIAPGERRGEEERVKLPEPRRGERAAMIKKLPVRHNNSLAGRKKICPDIK
jgi:hypothetical protein